MIQNEPELCVCLPFDMLRIIPCFCANRIHSVDVHPFFAHGNMRG